jgi:hypothetical protein
MGRTEPYSSTGSDIEQRECARVAAISIQSPGHPGEGVLGRSGSHHAKPGRCPGLGNRGHDGRIWNWLGRGRSILRRKWRRRVPGLLRLARVEPPAVRWNVSHRTPAGISAAGTQAGRRTGANLQRCRCRRQGVGGKPALPSRWHSRTTVAGAAARNQREVVGRLMATGAPVNAPKMLLPHPGGALSVRCHD